MATESVDRTSGHHRSVTVTTLASVMGILTAVVSEFVLAADPTATNALFVLTGAILVQFPILQIAGFDMDEFSTKDYIYVAFMTFSLWFVAWTLLLTVQQV